MRTFKLVLLASVLVSLLIGPIASAQGGLQTNFPEARRELLSGAAEDALFGTGALGPMQIMARRALASAITSHHHDSSGAFPGPNIRVNDEQQASPNGLLGRSETTIAASRNGKRLLVGWNDAQGFCGPPFGAACTPQTPPGLSGYGYSTDSGETWTDGGGPDALGTNVLTRGDPWMTRSRNTFFYANLAVDATTGAGLGVSVHRGHFQGSSFVWDDVQTFDSPNNANECTFFGSPAPCDFYDKEAIVADDRGNAYVSLTNFQETCGIAQWGWGTIEVWRTHDGGDTWQGPAIAGPDQSFILDPTDPNCGAEGHLQQSSVPAIGPRGEVYVTWQRGPTFLADGSTTPDAEIVVARSLDGGVTFDEPVVVAHINSMRNNSPVAYNRSRINDHPRIAVVQSGGHRGAVYVVFYSAVEPVGPEPIVPCPAGTTPPTTVCRSPNLTSSQIYISYSEDKGLSWSTPQPVAPPVPDTGVKRFWPVVNVEAGTNVYVVYYESQEVQVTDDPNDIECNRSVDGGRRISTVSSLIDVYLVRSHTATWTWEDPVKVTSVTSNWCPQFNISNIRPNLGDYIDSVTTFSNVMPVWADGRNGVPDTFFSNVEIK